MVWRPIAKSDSAYPSTPCYAKLTLALLAPQISGTTVLAILAAGAVTLSFKLPNPAAALESIHPAIVTIHLQQMQDQVRCPKVTAFGRALSVSVRD